MVMKAAKALIIRMLTIKGFRRVEKVAVVPPSFLPGS